MTVRYGLTIENQAAIQKKAANKNDGVYTFRGVAYRVRGGKAIYFAYYGEVLAPYGHFNVHAGSYDHKIISGIDYLKKAKEQS